MIGESTSASSLSIFSTSSFWRSVTLTVLLLLATCAGVGSSSFGTRVADSSIRFRNDFRHRKLVSPDSCSSGVKKYKPKREWGKDECSESDIVIVQGPSPPLPSGIPTYSVTIGNACPSGCDIAGIHVRCGKFASAKLINPDIFKRLDYDDCLVYGGRPLPNGMILSFEYANTFPYPMDVIKYECCPL